MKWNIFINFISRSQEKNQKSECTKLEVLSVFCFNVVKLILVMKHGHSSD